MLIQSEKDVVQAVMQLTAVVPNLIKIIMGEREMKSIISNEKKCFFCGNPYVHKHHIYFGANRRISEQNGFWVYLCPAHHNFSDIGVHFNRQMDLLLKQLCQREYEKTHTREEFISLIGKSYL